MALETTYAHLREDLATILDRLGPNQDVVILRRKGAEDVALIPVSELAGLVK